MSDFNGLEMTDVLGLADPLTKLFETVACGVGKLYEPIHVKRMAKAKAEELKLISDTIGENIHLPICYQNGTIGIDTSDANDLVQRAQNRFLFQQMKKQQNIESVVANAYNELESKTTVSDKPVDEDWISSFFDFVANISSEQMQYIWGKLLAGEIENPGSFSIRTLDILRKLSQDEAQQFMELFPYILSCTSDVESTSFDYFLPCIKDLKTEKLNYDYYKFSSIMMLDEAGLISSDGNVTVSFEVEPDLKETIYSDIAHIQIKNISGQKLTVFNPAHYLTAAGKELYTALHDKNNIKHAKEGYLQAFVDSFEEYQLDEQGRIVRFEVTINYNT